MSKTTTNAIENTNIIPVNLYGEQYNILQDWLNVEDYRPNHTRVKNRQKHCISILPVGSGKTFMASIALPIIASRRSLNKGRDVIYSAPTTQMIKSLIWEPLKQNCIKYFNLVDGRDINNSDLTIKFPDSVFIRCKSAEQRENLRGLNVGVWIADEAALYSTEVLQEITNRLRPSVGQTDSDNFGKLIIISTPNGNGPLKEIYDSAVKNRPGWRIHHYNYMDMRSGNLEFIEQQRQILSPLKFAQDYMCQWESIENQFYYTWRPTFIGPTVDSGGVLYSFHDWNKRVNNAIIAQVTGAGEGNGTIEILKTYSIPNCGTEQLAQAIRSDYPQRVINSIIDMSGTQLNRDTTSPFGVTDRTIIERYGFTVINSRASNPLITDTDNSSNSFINRGGLTVPSECVQLIEALNSYHYSDGSRKRLVKSTDVRWAHIDGLGDALRYGIHQLFPVRHETSSPNYVTDHTHVRPGSEYLPYSPLYPGGPSWEEILAGTSNSQDYVTP